jgi:[acyl-carrier-protein] S-malonyltransferase
MKLAFLFPGQGAQRVGMGAELAKNFSVARETFQEADDALGFALSTLCFEGPEEDLKLTANTQPAMVTAAIAALRVFESEHGASSNAIAPVVGAGHSLGEYSALVAAGALRFTDAVLAVRERGRLMQAACPSGQGAMAALIGLDLDVVNEICAAVSEGGAIAVPANLNAPGQIVIAGNAAQVRKAIEVAKERGAAMSVELKVSAPFHCALMKPAQDAMTQILRALQVSALQFPVIANVTAEPNSDPARVVPLLIEQITAPVRWAESMEKLAPMGVTDAIEFGCGKVLTGMMKRIDKSIRTRALEDLASLKAIGEAISAAKS